MTNDDINPDDPQPDNAPQGDPEERPPPPAVMLTIDLTDKGRITCWTASHLDGQILEDWRLVGQFMTAEHSHTWQMAYDAYLIARDILRYLTEADWQPGTAV